MLVMALHLQIAEEI